MVAISLRSEPHKLDLSSASADAAAVQAFRCHPARSGLGFEAREIIIRMLIPSPAVVLICDHIGLPSERVSLVDDQFTEKSSYLHCAQIPAAASPGNVAIAKQMFVARWLHPPRGTSGAGATVGDKPCRFGKAYENASSRVCRRPSPTPLNGSNLYCPVRKLPARFPPRRAVRQAWNRPLNRDERMVEVGELKIRRERPQLGHRVRPFSVRGQT